MKRKEREAEKAREDFRETQKYLTQTYLAEKMMRNGENMESSTWLTMEFSQWKRWRERSINLIILSKKKVILRLLFLQLFQLLAVQILHYGKGSFLLHDIA